MSTFKNEATITYKNKTITSNAVTGVILNDIAIHKSAFPKTYIQGDTITYTINLTNYSDTDLTNLTITDNLGGTGDCIRPLDYVNGSAKILANGEIITPTSYYNRNLTITNINIPKQTSIIVYYQATVNAYASPEESGKIINTATLTGNNISTQTAHSRIIAHRGAKLTIKKILTPLVVNEDGTITYTFKIRNSGNLNTTDNVIFEDTFTHDFNITSVRYNKTQEWIQNINYEYNNYTHTFKSKDNQIVVPKATFSFDATTNKWITTPGTAIIEIKGTI